MATRFHLRSRIVAVLTAVVSVAIMLWLPLAGSAQDAPNLTVTPVSTAQASTTNTVSFLPTSGAGGNTEADVYLVLAFTAVTVLGLVALAILDRTPDSPDRALSGDAVA